MKVTPIRKTFVHVLLVCATVALSGCAFRIVPRETMEVHEASGGQPEVLRYPLKALVHDDESFWDLHQAKDNIAGLTEFEVVRMADLIADTAMPGPERRPVENSIEWFKDQWAKLPQIPPVRLVGELFWALGIEKTCYVRSESFFPRIIYLTEFAQQAMIESNNMLGYVILQRDGFVPSGWTDPSNRGVDWAQSRLLGLYTWLFQELDWCLDQLLYGAEMAWAEAIRATVVTWYPAK